MAILSCNKLSPFQLSILGLSELNHRTLNPVSHAVSLIDPGSTLPLFFKKLNSNCHLVLEVHDALSSTEEKRAPSREDALLLCHYAAKLCHYKPSHLLVHCHMGRSRSSAAAAIILVKLGMSPSDAFSYIRSVRAPIWPNWTLIECGDNALHAKGELMHACQKLYGEIERQFPRWVADPRPEMIA